MTTFNFNLVMLIIMVCGNFPQIEYKIQIKNNVEHKHEIQKKIIT